MSERNLLAEEANAGYSLDVLEDCARREVAMRRRVYPRFVEEKKMSQHRADRELEMMEAIANLLKDLRLKAAVRDPAEYDDPSNAPR